MQLKLTARQRDVSRQIVDTADSSGYVPKSPSWHRRTIKALRTRGLIYETPYGVALTESGFSFLVPHRETGRNGEDAVNPVTKMQRDELERLVEEKNVQIRELIGRLRNTETAWGIL